MTSVSGSDPYMDLPQEPDGLLGFLDQESRLISANSNLLSMLGMEGSEMDRIGFPELLVEGSRFRILGDPPDSRESGKGPWELFLVVREGEWSNEMVSLNFIPLFTRDGDSGTMLTGRSMGVLKTDEGPDDPEREMDVLFRKSGNGLLRVNSGRIVDANECALEILRTSMGELRGLPPDIFFREITGDNMTEGIGIRADGEKFPLEARIAWTGSVGTGFLIFRDITESRMRSTRMKILAEVVESSREGIVVLDSDMRAIVMNRGAEGFLEGNRDDMIGKRFEPGSPGSGEGPGWKRLFGSIRSVSNWSGFLNIDDDGSASRDVAVSVWPMVLDGKERYSIIQFRDLSELIDLERNMELMGSLLSHDLRNHDRAITDDLKMLRKGIYGEMTPEQERVLNRALEQSSRMNDLITNARKLMRTWEDSEKLEPIDIIPIMEWAADVVKASNRDRKVRIDLPEDISSVKIMADILARDIFQNLFDNSVKHSRGEVRISVNADIRDDRLTLHIDDNGFGIEDSRKQRVFRKFDRSGRSEGTGMGLYLVKRLMERYGGSVKIEDRVPERSEEGTRFILFFPLLQLEEDAPFNTIETLPGGPRSGIRIRRETREDDVYFIIGSMSIPSDDVWRVPKSDLSRRYGWNLAPVLERAVVELPVDGTYIWNESKGRFQSIR